MDRRKLWVAIGVGLLAAVLVTALVWVFTASGERTLHDVVAEEFGVAEPDLLVLNLPPKPSRYPGSLLLTWNGLPFQTVKAEDPNLERGAPTLVSGTHDELRQGQGSVTAAVFSEIVKAGRNVSLSFHCEDARTVEMSARTIQDRVRKHVHAEGDSEVNSSTRLTVVVRSYEGKIGTKVKRSTRFAVEGWTKLNTDLQALASTDNEAKIKVTSAANDEFEVSVEEPTVFAFEAARVDEFLANVPEPQRHRPVEAPGDAEPNRSIRELMEFEPTRIPDLAEALKEIGPAAEPAILDVMKAGDKKVRERGAYFLKNLPHLPRASLPTPGDMLKSRDPILRARAVRMLGEQGAAALPQLKVALEDKHPAVKFLAIDAVRSIPAASEEVLPTLTATMEDSDAANREAVLERVGDISVDPAVDVRVREAARRALERSGEPGRSGGMRPLEGPGP